MAVGLSFGLNVIAPRMQRDVPERLGNLDLTGTLKGTEALERVNRLHGLDLELSSAFVAEYAHSSPYHGNSQATIWIGRAENIEAAAHLTRRMAESIEKGGSSFSNLRQLTIDNYEVFQVNGPGGDHFFYNSVKQSETVVWVSIEADDPLLILKEAVKAF